MSLEKKVCDFLNAIPALAAAGCQAYPVFAADTATAPYATYRRMASAWPVTLGGTLPMTAATFRVTVWAATHAEAVALAKAVRTACMVGRAAIGIEGVQQLKPVNEFDEVEVSPELTSEQVFGRAVDVMIQATDA